MRFVEVARRGELFELPRRRHHVFRVEGGRGALERMRLSLKGGRVGGGERRTNQIEPLGRVVQEHVAQLGENLLIAADTFEQSSARSGGHVRPFSTDHADSAAPKCVKTGNVWLRPAEGVRNRTLCACGVGVRDALSHAKIHGAIAATTEVGALRCHPRRLTSSLYA